ncbi:MAG: sialate O-acetylesterase [Bryobacterales bacterium]|nr:sialate O-acetylesterase [Bryobacterales bacterium]
MKTALFVLFLAVQLWADVRLPALISDNMVLQQQRPVRIWGKATVGETVTVSMAGQKVEGHANEDGQWQVFLAPMLAGGPFEMTIQGGNTLTIRNVLVGEVWVASGQSNMAWTLKNSKGSDEEIPRANHPQIRFFHVKTRSLEQPADDVEDATWKVINPDTAGAVSGVGYFFAKHLHQMRGVPIGILQSAVGGTPAQAWTSRETMLDNPALQWYVERWQKFEAAYPEAKGKYEARLAEWQKEVEAAKVAGKTPPVRPNPPPGAPGHVHTPTGLYNGMIAPLLPYAIRGAIWYQGEANAGPTDNELYRTLFAEMIQDWRRNWGQGPFPFLWVQLASYGRPAPGTWPVLRDSQTATLSLVNTGQALAIDVGESTDIHPRDKTTVGNRLALAARAVAYGERIVHSGPVFRQVTTESGKLRVWFDHTGTGLASRDGGALTGFRIAGSDGSFYKAEAHVEGNTVVLARPLVKNPEQVRYAWENDPAANLVNREGLPATPFRTDRWQ